VATPFGGESGLHRTFWAVIAALQLFSGGLVVSHQLSSHDEQVAEGE
jgi:hypothetical protein